MKEKCTKWLWSGAVLIFVMTGLSSTPLWAREPVSRENPDPERPEYFAHLVFEEARIVLPVAFARSAAGYVTITNQGLEARRIVAVDSPLARQVELHNMDIVTDQSDNEYMQMRPLADGLLLPPAETVTLEPGGLHIMLMGLDGESLSIDQVVPLTLTFADGAVFELFFRVRSGS